MFRWYRDAVKCYVYLSDVPTLTSDHNGHTEQAWQSAFRISRWFTRGWTLQELLAPRHIEFFSREEKLLGSKKTLEELIHKITDIPIAALQGAPLSGFLVDERLFWAAKRDTKKKEDKAYCLLGIFNVFMPLIYGEEDNAFIRLKEEIDKRPGEKATASPLPSSTVPFRHDADFVDRKASQDGRTLLEQIEQQCTVPAARVALVGIGGVGKSQLAIEYCHRLRKRSTHTWVFWIHASNVDRIEQGYRNIAERVNIPGRKNPKEDIFELVARWLRDESKGTWLLVLDNLDDGVVLSAPPAAVLKPQSSDSKGQVRQPLSVYLPQSQNGTILVTTRTRSVAIKLVERRDIIPIDGEKDEDQDIKKDGVSEANNDDVFEEAVERLRSYSFVTIGEDGRTFEMHALVQLAMRKWLKMHGMEERWKAQFSRKLNAVFPTGDHKNWSLCKKLFPHAKAAESQRPAKNRSLQDWAQILRRAGSYAWAKGDYIEAERMCELSAGVLRKVFGEEDVETLNSQGMLALVYKYRGRWTEAEKMHVQVVETRRKVLGEEHPDTLTSIANLASTYRNQGRWKEAEKIGMQIVEMSRRVLGEEHPDTLNSMANLASTYWNQGRWMEAEKIDMQVAEMSWKVPGEEHPDTLTSMANLASIYRDQGRWTEAENMDMRVMETRRKVLGKEHPDTLTSMNNLAFTMKGQRRRMHAIKLMTECIQLCNKILGPEHPHTLSSAAVLVEWSDNN